MIAARSTAWRRSSERLLIQQGAVVPGADVEVRQVASGKTRHRDAANAAGQFSLSGLPAGDYEVQVSRAGIQDGIAGLHASGARPRRALRNAVDRARLEVVEVTAQTRCEVQT